MTGLPLYSPAVCARHLRRCTRQFGIAQKSVPFCRAANGALARRSVPVSLWAMAIKLRVITRWLIRFRAQRRTREILLALALTLAALAFIVAAISGADQHAQSLPQSYPQSSHVQQSGVPQDDPDR